MPSPLSWNQCTFLAVWNPWKDHVSHWKIIGGNHPKYDIYIYIYIIYIYILYMVENNTPIIIFLTQPTREYLRLAKTWALAKKPKMWGPVQCRQSLDCYHQRALGVCPHSFQLDISGNPTVIVFEVKGELKRPSPRQLPISDLSPFFGMATFTGLEQPKTFRSFHSTAASTWPCSNSNTKACAADSQGSSSNLGRL